MTLGIRWATRNAQRLLVQLVGGTPTPPEGVEVGKHIRGIKFDTFVYPSKDSQISVGSYCRIAAGVRILGATEHRTNLVSMYPIRTILPGNDREPHDLYARGPTCIGNDVWLGLESVIMSGVKVGDGAVVGARSVVTADVPPYAIVVGNPARIVRYRFSPEQILELQRIAWWNWSEEKIRECESDFYGDIDEFLRKHAHR